MGSQACNRLDAAAVELQHALVQLTGLLTTSQSRAEVVWHQLSNKPNSGAACLLDVAQIFVNSGLLQQQKRVATPSSACMTRADNAVELEGGDLHGGRL